MADNEKNEFSELLSQLGYSEADAREAEKEITETEQLLRREDKLAVSDEILQKVHDRVKDELRAIQVKRRQRSLLGKMAAAAAIAAVLMAAITIQWDGLTSRPEVESVIRTTSNDLIFTEEELWQDVAVRDLVLSHENQWADEVDDLLLDEVLIMWSTADWDLENILGKERNDESEIICSGNRISGNFRLT